MTLKPAALSWSAVCAATPSLPEMLNTCTSASFGPGLLLVGVAEAPLVVLVELVTLLDTGDAESSSEFPEEPRACQPNSRKITPRNNSTITMARRGSPEESGTRSFIEPTVARTRPESVKARAKTARVSGHLEAEPTRRPRLLTTGTQPPQPLHQHRVGGQCLRPVDECIEHLVIACRRH